LTDAGENSRNHFADERRWRGPTGALFARPRSLGRVHKHATHHCCCDTEKAMIFKEPGALFFKTCYAAQHWRNLPGDNDPSLRWQGILAAPL